MKEFVAGAIIKVRRGFYSHYGVYVGGGKVVHFSSMSKSEMDATTADVIITSIDAFAKGNEVCEDTRENAVFSPEEVVQRAMSAIGSKCGTYDLLNNNCEHFANWCRCGKLISHQKREVENVLDLLLNRFPVGRAVLAAMRQYSQTKDCELQKLYGDDNVDWFAGDDF